MDIREKGGSQSSLPKGGGSVRGLLAFLVALSIALGAGWMVINRQETVFIAPSPPQLEPSHLEDLP